MPDQSSRNEWTRAHAWVWPGWAGAFAAIVLTACSGEIGQAGGTSPIGSGTAGNGVPIGGAGGGAAGKRGRSLSPAPPLLVIHGQDPHNVHDGFGAAVSAPTHVASAPRTSGRHAYAR